MTSPKVVIELIVVLPDFYLRPIHPIQPKANMSCLDEPSLISSSPFLDDFTKGSNRIDRSATRFLSTTHSPNTTQGKYELPGRAFAHHGVVSSNNALEFGLARRVRLSCPASACSFSTLRLNLVLTHEIPLHFRIKCLVVGVE